MLAHFAIRGARVARTVLATAIIGFGAISALQCSASSSTSGGGANGGQGASGGGHSGSGGGGGLGADGGINIPDSQVKDYSADQFFVDDPPPQACDGGGKVTVPGGTPECPDDKNFEGCPCLKAGETAACWPGYRKNRNHGNCKDGQTTCMVQGENKYVWGECKGFTGIDATGKPLGTTGKAACTCFSGGYWKLVNTSPCFYGDGTGPGTLGSVSTIGGANAQCPGSFALPSEAWSANTVKADCTGYFKLCYTLKALASPGAQPAATDCTMKQVCTEQHYDTVNVEQAFPDLSAWITDTGSETSCSQQFVANGGYAEMSVSGQSDECDMVPDHVFQTVTYCPLKCADAANAQDPECVNCQNGGGGPF
jgi:hypothetical protein